MWVAPPGAQLNVLDWGGRGRRPLVCLHGIGGNAWLWNALAPRLADGLAETHRVLSVDMRGHGDSSKPPSGYEPDAVGDDLVALCDHLGAERMTLIGHSRGGWQAAFVGARWPSRVDNLVLVDPARFRFDAEQDSLGYYAGVAKLLGPFADADEALAVARSRDPEALWTEERQAAFLHGLEATDDGQLRGKMRPSVLEALRDVRRRDWLSEIADQLTAPALLFVATKSDQRRQAQKLEYAERLADVEVVRLHTTHYMAYDATDDVERAILAFLSAR